MRLMNAEGCDVSCRLRWENGLAAWLMVLTVGIGATAIGVYQHFFPPGRAWDPMRVPAPTYLWIGLGGTLVGASLAGVIKRWGPLIPTFVVAVLVGLLLMPVTNSRPRDTGTAAIVLGLSMIIALAVDALRSKGVQRVTAECRTSDGDFDELTHTPTSAAKTVCRDDPSPPER